MDKVGLNNFGGGLAELKCSRREPWGAPYTCSREITCSMLMKVTFTPRAIIFFAIKMNGTQWLCIGHGNKITCGASGLVSFGKDPMLLCEERKRPQRCQSGNRNMKRSFTSELWGILRSTAAAKTSAEPPVCDERRGQAQSLVWFDTSMARCHRPAVSSFSNP